MCSLIPPLCPIVSLGSGFGFRSGASKAKATPALSSDFLKPSREQAGAFVPSSKGSQKARHFVSCAPLPEPSYEQPKEIQSIVASPPTQGGRIDRRHEPALALAERERPGKHPPQAITPDFYARWRASSKLQHHSGLAPAGDDDGLHLSPHS